MMTSDTLTMVPAGSHQRQRSSSLFDSSGSGFLDSILSKNKIQKDTFENEGAGKNVFNEARNFHLKRTIKNDVHIKIELI